MMRYDACTDIWPDHRVYYQRLRRKPDSCVYGKWHWLLGVRMLEPYLDDWPRKKTPTRWAIGPFWRLRHNLVLKVKRYRTYG